MKIFLVNTIILLSLISLNKNISAQDFKTDLALMHKAYNNIENLHAEAELRVFSSHRSENYKIAKRITVMKQGENFFYKLGHYQLLLTEKDHLIVNDNARSMYYSQRDENLMNAGIEQTIPDLENVINKAGSIVFIGYDNTTLHYSISTPEEDIQTTELFIDKKNKLIQKLIYYYNPEKYANNNKVEIYFNKLNISPVFKGSTFDLAKFIVRSANTFKPVESYSDYSLKINDHNM